MNYDDLVEEDDSIDFDEIAKRANPALFSNQSDDTQYVGANYQDFFGDDLNLSSLPTEDPKMHETSSKDVPVSIPIDIDKEKGELSKDRELIPQEDEGLKIISLPSEDQEGGSELLTDLSKAFSQPEKVELDSVYSDENYTTEDDQVLHLDNSDLSDMAEDKNLNKAEESKEGLSLQKIEEELEESSSTTVGGESEQPLVIKKEDNEAEDINLVGHVTNPVIQEPDQENSLLDLVGEDLFVPSSTPEESPPAIVALEGLDNNAEITSESSEPKVDELTTPKKVLKNIQNTNEGTLENLLSEIVPVSELSSEESYEVKAEPVSQGDNQDEAEKASVTPNASAQPSPASALDQTLAKMNTGSNLNSLLDESLKEAKDYDLEKLDFHFAHIDKENPNDAKKEDNSSNSDEHNADKEGPAPPAVPATAKSQGFSPPPPAGSDNSRTENALPMVNQSDFPGLSPGRHFDFTGGVEDIVIHDEKIRLKKSLGNILAVLIIILFVCALGYIAFKIYNEVKIII